MMAAHRVVSVAALAVTMLVAAASAQVPDSIPPAPDAAALDPDSMLAASAIGTASLPRALLPDLSGLGGYHDTLGLRIEIGARADVTNEEYVSYDDAFVDTTFQVRKLVSTPERRYAGVLTTLLQGTRNGQATRYELRNDLSLGNLIQRGALGLAWRSEIGVDWDLFAAPYVEYRHDRTFDRDRQEVRGGMSARLRRALRPATTFVEAGSRLESVRTRGEGANYLLDRDAATLALGIEHLGLLGDEWRFDYGLTGRQFPDSATRDHLEHAGGLMVRRDFSGGHLASLDGRLVRRSTVRPTDVSRDNYWAGEASAAADARLQPGWLLRSRVDAEGVRYDVEDDTLYFNFHILRGRLGLRFDRDARWNLTVGPRVERLESPLSPSDAYFELAGTVELEILARGTWWSVTPALGRRRYDEVPGTAALLSSYDFIEVGAFADQALGGGLRARGMGSWRHELHDDETQDARSLYVSLEVVWAPR